MHLLFLLPIFNRHPNPNPAKARPNALGSANPRLPAYLLTEYSSLTVSKYLAGTDESEFAKGKGKVLGVGVGVGEYKLRKEKKRKKKLDKPRGEPKLGNTKEGARDIVVMHLAFGTTY